MKEKQPIKELKKYSWIPRELEITTGVESKARELNRLYEEWIAALIKKYSKNYDCHADPIQEWTARTCAEKGDSRYLIRDFIILPKQTDTYVLANSNSSSLITYETKRRSRKLKKNLYANGILHNHSNFEAFHSDDDDKTMEDLSRLTMINQVRIREDGLLFETAPRAYVEQETVVLKNDNGFDPAIILKLNGEMKNSARNRKLKRLCALLNETDISYRQPIGVSFETSIVMNKAGDLYGEIYVVEENLTTYKKTITPYLIDVKVVEAEDDIALGEKEIKQLQREMKKKMNPKIEYYEKNNQQYKERADNKTYRDDDLFGFDIWKKT